MNIILLHIAELMPFYIIFELFYYNTKKIFRDFNTTYFLLHFIINMINSVLLIPSLYVLVQNPYEYIQNYSLLSLEDTYIKYIYPIIISLHTFHLIHHLHKINYDEIFHHACTHIFWYIIHHTNNRLMILSIISMSGIPGGITYLMLYLEKVNKLKKIKINYKDNNNIEKKISMYLNIWIRSPLCIIFSTFLYIQLYIHKELYENYYYSMIFVILFTSINGIHFMHNITESYYINKIKNN
jgi:hypothetical protein